MIAREFTARYVGVCSDCEGPIRPGQTVKWAPISIETPTVIHATCPEPLEGDVCPKCFMRRALSGECGCDQ